MDSIDLDLFYDIHFNNGMGIDNPSLKLAGIYQDLVDGEEVYSEEIKDKIINDLSKNVIGTFFIRTIIENSNLDKDDYIDPSISFNDYKGKLNNVSREVRVKFADYLVSNVLTHFNKLKGGNKERVISFCIVNISKIHITKGLVNFNPLLDELSKPFKVEMKKFILKQEFSNGNNKGGI